MSQLQEERKRVVLHQQQGGISLADFAALHDMTVGEVRKFAAEGKILGANQDSRSNRWTIYPPAKLLVTIKRQGKKCGTPFADKRVMQACHDLKLINATQKFKVMLSGAQVLAIESNLSKVAEKLKRQCVDVDDFEDGDKANYGEKLNLIFTILAALKHAAQEAPSVRAAGALRAGFPTAIADCFNDLTEAQAGARRDASPAMGIPEGGKSSAPSASARCEPSFSLPSAFDFAPAGVPSVIVQSGEVLTSGNRGAECLAALSPNPEGTRVQLYRTRSTGYAPRDCPKLTLLRRPS